MPEATDRAPLAPHQIGVLLVQDDALLVIDVGERLATFGLVVFEASDAEAAIAMLEARSNVRVPEPSESQPPARRALHPVRFASKTVRCL